MRVVGGIAKGRNLASPAIPGARPTLELVRGAIFNILGSNLIEGARIVTSLQAPAPWELKASAEVPPGRILLSSTPANALLFGPT